jgi:hypothetical protein
MGTNGMGRKVDMKVQRKTLLVFLLLVFISNYVEAQQHTITVQHKQLAKELYTLVVGDAFLNQLIETLTEAYLENEEVKPYAGVIRE